MRVLLDELIPRQLARELPGHEVRTVSEMGWAGKKNGALLALIPEAGFEVLVTTDQNLEYQQNLQRAGIPVIVFVALRNTLQSLLPLMPGVRFVAPWSEVERFSTREEQFPDQFAEAEVMPALSSEQMGMTVDVALRWQIDPIEAPRIFAEIGGQEQIRSVVLNAIRNGVRDGMARFSINDIARRAEVADVMRGEVDSALVTQPRGGGPQFRIATVTAFFLRNLQPPEQVVNAINGKIAQEQQIETERHRVEVARLQSEQQRLLNQTLTPEALLKQYLEVLHDMRTSNNLVVLVPTEGGVPLLDLAALRRNIKGN